MKINKRVSTIDGVEKTSFDYSEDSRGSFVKFQSSLKLMESLDSVAISFNPHAGTVRGLHFQIEPYSEEKLVSCISGAIYDVVVDLRPNSPTFAHWTSFELNANNFSQLYLPKGVAHGFQTLLSNSIVHYSISKKYSPESAFSINPCGELAIDWPLEIVSVSEKDFTGLDFSTAAKIFAESLK
jgi:dTDP-4-dehydrorhamnose 3,5-epimerase